jgi:hypothetical protein
MRLYGGFLRHYPFEIRLIGVWRVFGGTIFVHETRASRVCDPRGA